MIVPRLSDDAFTEFVKSEFIANSFVFLLLPLLLVLLGGRTGVRATGILCRLARSASILQHHFRLRALLQSAWTCVRNRSSAIENAERHAVDFHLHGLIAAHAGQ